MNQEVQSLIDQLYADAEKIKFDCPTEVIRLFKYGIVPSRQTGVWDQTLTTMVFCEGDMRQMSAYMLFMLTRLPDHGTFSASQLKEIFLDTVPLSAEFVGTCGLESMWTNCQKVMAVLDKVDTVEDFKELMESLSAYATNMHNWVHLMFPWYIGDLFPRTTPEKVKEMAALI